MLIKFLISVMIIGFCSLFNVMLFLLSFGKVNWNWQDDMNQNNNNLNQAIVKNPFRQICPWGVIIPMQTIYENDTNFLQTQLQLLRWVLTWLKVGFASSLYLKTFIPTVKPIMLVIENIETFLSLISSIDFLKQRM